MFIEYICTCVGLACMLNVRACVHRYVCHQLSSVQKSKTLSVSNTITDIVCQVWDAPGRVGG